MALNGTCPAVASATPADTELMLMGQIAAAPMAVIWMLAGPVTYILNVVDTWHGSSAPVAKLLTNVTLDAFLAAIWPATWVLWGIISLGGGTTPLHWVHG